MDVALINDEFVPLSEARVSVLDRGLLFADSVYEVIPVYSGHPFCLNRHLSRLQNSLNGLRIDNPYSRDGWRDRLTDLIGRNGNGDIALYVQVTRGAPARRDHRLPENPQPNVIAFCQPRTPPDPAVMKRGIKAVIQDDTRWDLCHIKSTSLLANVLAADRARAAGAAEAILVRNGEVLEGTSSNVFAVLDGRLVTPALRPTILPGITREVILELATQNALDHAELNALSTDALRRAEEIWITSSTREIHAVTRLDSQQVGNGMPGPLWTRMRAWLQAVVHE